MKLLRNYIIGLSVVALIAVTLAILSGLGYLTRADQVVLSPQDPFTVREGEEGRPELAQRFRGLLRRATLLEHPPQIPDGTTAITLQTRTEGGVFVGAYSLHILSMIDRNALLEDLQEHRFYKVAVRDFELFLSDGSFEDLPLKRYESPPLALESSFWEQKQILTPQSEHLKLFTPDGTVQSTTRRNGTGSKILLLTREQASQKPTFRIAPLPDAWSLTLTAGNTDILTQDRVKISELVFPSEPGVYTYQLTAHWDLSTQRDWYGDLNYVLEVHITEPEPEPDVPENPDGEEVDS